MPIKYCVILLVFTFLYSCQREEDVELLGQVVEEVTPIVEQEESVVFFLMNDESNNQILNLEQSMAESIEDQNVYGVAEETLLFHPDTTVMATVYIIGVSDSIQFFWTEEQSAALPHKHSFDAATNGVGEKSYIVANPISNELGSVFTVRKEEIEITEVGAVGSLIKGNYTAEISINVGAFREVSGSFAVPRYE